MGESYKTDLVTLLCPRLYIITDPVALVRRTFGTFRHISSNTAVATSTEDFQITRLVVLVFRFLILTSLWNRN